MFILVTFLVTPYTLFIAINLVFIAFLHKIQVNNISYEKYNFSFLNSCLCFYRYGTALNIIRNNDVEFLGFTSLKKISANHVLIEANPKLCYLEKLKWGKVFKGTTKQNRFIKENADYKKYCGKVLIYSINIGLLCSVI